MKTFLAVLLLGVSLLAGCTSSSEGVDTSCSLSACTLTFDRGSTGSANVLGIDVKLVSADDTQATVDVGGQQVTVPVNGSKDVSGLQVSVPSVTEDKVTVRVARPES
jgi:hypothetical protein